MPLRVEAKDPVRVQGPVRAQDPVRVSCLLFHLVDLKVEGVGVNACENAQAVGDVGGRLFVIL